MRARFIQTVSPFKGGTKMTYGGKFYHFLPNELGDYVAEVSDEQHYDAILSIGAGYRPYSDIRTEAAAAAVQARIDADTALRTAAETRSNGVEAIKTDRMAAARAAKAAKKATTVDD
jgi:hypothetical protein